MVVSRKPQTAEVHTKQQPAPKTNDRQVGGNHYQQGEIQHWDFAADHNYDYFQGVITKYIDRWKEKNGLEDLHKAKHYLEKYIEIEEAKQAK